MKLNEKMSLLILLWVQLWNTTSKEAKKIYEEKQKNVIKLLKYTILSVAGKYEVLPQFNWSGAKKKIILAKIFSY